MQRRFYIILSLKTPTGFAEYGQYYFGNDRHAADELFNTLQGSRDVAEHLPLHIDLMETINELPVKIKTIGCTLDELAYNTKLITREVFRLKNLEDME